jgi:hypothetical protein
MALWHFLPADAVLALAKPLRNSKISSDQEYIFAWQLRPGKL